jgi:hypothetical protein
MRYILFVRNCYNMLMYPKAECDKDFMIERVHCTQLLLISEYGFWHSLCFDSANGNRATTFHQGKAHKSISYTPIKKSKIHIVLLPENLRAHLQLSV